MSSEPSKPVFQPTDYEIVERKRQHDGVFKLDELKVRHQLYDGRMDEVRSRLVLERGDAAAALLFDPEHREVILVEQFRAATLRGRDGGVAQPGKGNGQGWLLETAAGIIRDGKEPGTTAERPDQAIIREVREEVGYQVTDLLPVAEFFPSPGGTSEKIHLFYAEVRQAQLTEPGQGVRSEGEDIRTVKVPLGEFIRRLDARELQDAKLIIAGMWLKARRQGMNTKSPQLSAPALFNVTGATGRQVGYQLGDIGQVDGIDAWVNPENTDMMMDRFFNRSVSARIRYLGATKYERSSNVKDDLIADDLADKMHGRKFVKPGTVVETTSGQLRRSNGVRCILHVAAVAGQIGEGITTDLKTLEGCMDEVLSKAEASRAGCASVLVPMMGTGSGGFQVRDVAPMLVDRAIQYLQRNPSSRIAKVVFLGYSIGDGDILADIFNRHCNGDRVRVAQG